MPITPPTPANSLPSLDRSSPSFRADLDTLFLSQLPATVPALNALGANVYANATEAATAAQVVSDQAATIAAQTLTVNTKHGEVNTWWNQVDVWQGQVSTNAQTVATNTLAANLSATNAGTSANDAAASLASLQGAFNGTSTTSLTLGLGSKTLTTQMNKAWVAGQYLSVARTSAPTVSRMGGIITAYDPGTGALTFTSDMFSGTLGASFTDWTLGLSGATAGPADSSRNRIQNPEFQIITRGASFAAVAPGATHIDRWAHINIGSSAVITAEQSGDVPAGTGLSNSLRYTVTTADTSVTANKLVGLRHTIQGFNIRDLVGRPFVFAFWVRSSKTGSHAVQLSNSGIDRSYVFEYSVWAANTWQVNVCSIPSGLPSAGTNDFTNGAGLNLRFMLMAGSAYQGAAGSWLTGDFRATGSQVNVCDTVGNIFAVAGPQLESGSVSTPFLRRPIEIERALCRTYRRVESMFVGTATAPTNFAIDMRAAPTVSGGGAGFVSQSNANVLNIYQTSSGFQDIVIAADL